MTKETYFRGFAVFCNGCGATLRSEAEAAEQGWLLADIPTGETVGAYLLCFFCSQPEDEPLGITCLSSLDISQKNKFLGGQ
jgi:hypothetical protein